MAFEEAAGAFMALDVPDGSRQACPAACIFGKLWI